jgi:hypothetical protein
MTMLHRKSFPCFNPNDRVAAAREGVGVALTVHSGLEVTRAVLGPSAARELGEFLVALANAVDAVARPSRKV